MYHDYHTFTSRDEIPGSDYPEITIRIRILHLLLEPDVGKALILRSLIELCSLSVAHQEYLGHSIETYPVLAYRKEVMLVPQEVYLFDGKIRDNFHSYYEAKRKEILSDDQIKVLQLCCIDGT